MSPYNRNQAYDPNIIEALEKLPPVMKNNENKDVTIRHQARDETGKEHIAVSTHGLQVRDIEMIPQILKSPETCNKDPYNKNYKNYYGTRLGKHDSSTRNKGHLLKIITSILLDGNEEIITVYPTNSIKELKK